MTHQNAGTSALFTNILKEIKDFRLNGNIEGRDRFVEEDKLRFEQQRPCHRHPLTLAAGDRPHDNTDRRGDNRHQRNHLKGKPRAEDNAAEDIPPHLIGTKPVGGGRGLQPPGEIQGNGTAGGKQPLFQAVVKWMRTENVDFGMISEGLRATGLAVNSG